MGRSLHSTGALGNLQNPCIMSKAYVEHATMSFDPRRTHLVVPIWYSADLCRMHACIPATQGVSGQRGV